MLPVFLLSFNLFALANFCDDVVFAVVVVIVAAADADDDAATDEATIGFVDSTVATIVEPDVNVDVIVVVVIVIHVVVIVVIDNFAVLIGLLAKFFVKTTFDEMMSLLSLPRDYRLSRAERGLP